MNYISNKLKTTKGCKSPFKTIEIMKTDYRFWNNRIHPITGFRVNRQEEQLDSDVVRINKLRMDSIKAERFIQVDLEDMIEECEILTDSLNEN